MPMSKRARFAGLLHATGALGAILALRARATAPWLSILTYHRFPKPGRELFDDEVIDTCVDEFERHISCVKKHFAVIGVDELCAFALGEALPPNAVAITFDDGYLDNYEHALPILQRHACKAIFFVATSFTTERRLYWWDRVAYLMKQSARPVVELEYPSHFRVELADRPGAILKLLRFIKASRSMDMERFLAELSVATGIVWTRELELEFAERLLMTWDHVRALRQAGMDVQSHTRTHRVLQTLPTAELVAELEGSRRDLEREIGEAPRALAYPVGRPLCPSSPIRSVLSKAGYVIGLTNGTGPTPTWGRRDAFNIRRQTVARDLSTPLLLSMLAVPPLAPTHPW